MYLWKYTGNYKMSEFFSERFEIESYKSLVSENFKSVDSLSEELSWSIFVSTQVHVCSFSEEFLSRGLQ